MQGYLIINYIDITPEAWEIINTEHLELPFGVHTFEQKNIPGYKPIYYKQPKPVNPDPCDDEWEPPQYNLKEGEHRVEINRKKLIRLLEFYYIPEEGENATR